MSKNSLLAETAAGLFRMAEVTTAQVEPPSFAGVDDGGGEGFDEDVEEEGDAGDGGRRDARLARLDRLGRLGCGLAIASTTAHCFRLVCGLI